MGSNTNPELTYFVCTLGQAARLNKDKPHGFQTINDFIDVQAQRNPDLPAVGFPEVHSKGWSGEIFTYEDLCNGSKAIAQTLEGSFKAGTFMNLDDVKQARCIALLCPSSVDFLFVWLALMRMGCSVLIIAPQCQPAAIAHLCRSCNVSLLLFDETYQDLALASSNEPSANHISTRLPWQRPNRTIVSLLRKSAILFMNFRSHAQEETDIAYIFHTSGTSTGLPKPIPQTHHAAIGVLPCLDGKEAATFTTTPLYHGGIADCFRAWTSNAMIWLFPGADAPITSKNILKCLSIAEKLSQHNSGIPAVKYFSSVPYILQMLSEEHDCLLSLQKMNLVGVGGAALPQAVGDQIVSQRVNLVSRFGSAECGFLLSSHRAYESDDGWQFLRVPPEAKFLKFEKQDEGVDLFELIVLKDWPYLAKQNRPDGSFATSDLFEPHPSIPNAWRYHSRSDSQLTLLTGKKFDPAPVEEAITSSSVLIRDAVIFGNGRQFPGVLIFPSEQSKELSEKELKQAVWKEIDRLNRKGQHHTRILQNMIVFIHGDTEPLAKSSKGTLLRGIAEKRFQKDIERAYENEDRAGITSRALEDGKILSVVRNIVYEVVETQLSDDQDFYHAGVDSTRATQIRNLLQRMLAPPGISLPWNIVYDGGNVKRLAEILHNIHDGRISQPKDEATYMHDLRHEYTTRIPIIPRINPILEALDRKAGHMVILTGATGSLGAHILDLLRKDHSVFQIICLVRASSTTEAKKRVSDSLLKRRKQGLAAHENRILCLAAILRKRGFGLEDHHLRTMYNHTTTIIHAAWAVNFSLPLESFVQDHIAGLANLLAFSRECVGDVRFIFCSSTASVIAQPPPIRESISKDPRDSDSLGYSKSKWVAEAICDDHHHRSFRKLGQGSLVGNSTVVLRIGQLTGDTENGVWNMTEAWPLMLSTVKDLGCLPDLDEPLSWLPVDIAARAVLQIANNEDQVPLENFIEDDGEIPCPVYHLVNNSISTTWKDLLRWLKSIENLDFDIVESTEWLNKLEKLESHPAKALLGLWRKAYGGDSVTKDRQLNKSPSKHQNFQLTSEYKGFQFSTEKTRSIAGIRSDGRPVDEDLVRKIWAWLDSEMKRDKQI